MTVATLIAILAPSFGLGGTLLGLWLGHRRWKREQSRDDSEQYRERLRNAYFELWEVTENAHLEMRADFGYQQGDRLAEFVATVNNFAIRQGLYIERRDRHLVLEYLLVTHEFLRQVAGTEEGRDAIATSASFYEMPRQLAELERVRDRAEELRGAVRKRIREVTGGDAGQKVRAAADSDAPPELLKQLRELKRPRRLPPYSGLGRGTAGHSDSDLGPDVWW